MQAPNGKKKKLIIAATFVLALPTSLMMLHHFTSLQDLPSSGNSLPSPGSDPSDTQTGGASGSGTAESPISANNTNPSHNAPSTVSSSGASGDTQSASKGNSSATDGAKDENATTAGTSPHVGTTVSAGTPGAPITPITPVTPATPSTAKAAPVAKAILQGTFSRFMGLFGGGARIPAGTGAPSSESGSSATSSSVGGPGMPLGTGAISNSLIGKEKPSSGADSDPTGNPAGATALLPSEPQQADGCVTVTFRHKKTSGHANEESCSQHKNLIRIKHLHPTSVCIRVNRTPVAYETVRGKTNEFIIGAVAGPRAEITARYCFGKSVCKEDCTVPKDDFMDAIGGGSGDTPSRQVAQWDANDTVEKDSDVNNHLDAAIKREMDRLDEQTQEASLFQDWLQGPVSPACGSRRVAGALSADG